MKFFRLLLLIVLIIVVGSETSFAVHKFDKISDDVKIVPEDLLPRLGQKGLEFTDSNWPKDIGRRKVDLAKVPDEVLQTAIDWMRIMIRDEWVPDDLKNQIIGIRKPKPGYFIVKDSNEENKIHMQEKGTVDYLIVRYKVDGHKIQVQENGIGMSILIDPNDSIYENQEIGNFMTDVIYRFLNYPKDKRGTLKFYLKSFTYENKKIYFGTVDCDFDRNDDEAWLRRTWWNHSYVWTDGQKVYINLVEMDGKPCKATYAKPGYPIRFDEKKKP